MPWQILDFSSPVLPIHAALLPPDAQGVSRVFFFAGSSNNLENSKNKNFEGGALWTYPENRFERPAPPTDLEGNLLDLFCASQSLLPDGNLLVAGGTIKYDNFQGASHVFIFDRDTRSWRPAAAMSNGRWYPTQVTLGDGQVLAASGTDQDEKRNTILEIYDPGTDRWQMLPASRWYPLYPHLFLLANGDIFYSGGYFDRNSDDDNNSATAQILNLPANSVTPIGGLRDENSRDQATTVLLPPAQNQQFLVIGGGQSNGNAIPLVDQIDLSSGAGSYIERRPLNHPRKHHQAVLLPDRTVFVCGGAELHEAGVDSSLPLSPSAASLPAEIYNPDSDMWTDLDVEGIPRLYHSVALLLPDGSVLSAGGNPRRLNECVNGFVGDLACEELRLSIYRPAYMDRERPEIDSLSTDQLSYGSTLTITTRQADIIQFVSLIRPMATTHSCDVEQRVVDIPIINRDATTLTVQLTTTDPHATYRNLAPPGWYMLFITTDPPARIPSEAKWVKVG
jgi:hypothetical protein